MLQYRIWGRGTGNAAEWQALTQGTQGKQTEKIRRSVPAASLSPVFALRVADQNKKDNKIKMWSINGLDGF